MNQTAQYLYIIRPTRLQMITEGPTPWETEIISKHSQYLEVLAKDGTIILYGRTQNNDETTFGIVIFKADSEQAARRIMENDPAVKGGIMRAALYPYRVALMGARPYDE